MDRKREIEMNFLRAVSQADELGDLSKELNTLVTETISDALKKLAVCWRGDNAELFLERCGEMTDELLGTADDLQKVSKNIKTTANIVYNAEKAAIQLGF